MCDFYGAFERSRATNKQTCTCAVLAIDVARTPLKTQTPIGTHTHTHTARALTRILQRSLSDFCRFEQEQAKARVAKLRQQLESMQRERNATEAASKWPTDAKLTRASIKMIWTRAPKASISRAAHTPACYTREY